MHCSFIFYGTLMDLGLLHMVTRLEPSSITLGFIKARIFMITDYTEPYGLHRYPLAVIDESESRTVALHVVYELFPKDVSKLWRKLLVFEGPLFEVLEIPFYCVNGETIQGKVFVAKKDFNPERHPGVSPLDTLKDSYLWTKQYCTPSS